MRSSSAKIGTKVFAPSIVPDELKVISDVSKTAYHKDWREIVEDNDKSMKDMGVSADVISRFKANTHINLTLAP